MEGKTIVVTTPAMIFAATTMLSVANRLVSRVRLHAHDGEQIGESDGDCSLRHDGNARRDDWGWSDT